MCTHYVIASADLPPCTRAQLLPPCPIWLAWVCHCKPIKEKDQTIIGPKTNTSKNEHQIINVASEVLHQLNQVVVICTFLQFLFFLNQFSFIYRQTTDHCSRYLSVFHIQIYQPNSNFRKQRNEEEKQLARCIQIYLLQLNCFSKFTLLPEGICSLSYGGLFQK